MSGSMSRVPVQGPAARMRCKRCGQVFTVRPGRAVSHFRRQGCVGGIPCDGELTAHVAVVGGALHREEESAAIGPPAT